MRVAIILGSLLVAAPALAVVEPEQSIPDRPLVIDEDELDIYGGFHFAVVTEPEADVADFGHIPLGIYYGLGSNVELGFHVDMNVRPAFTMALSPRARLAFGDSRALAIGLAMTLPLGFASYRLGPEALPLRLELPAFRYETSSGGIQALLAWHWAFAEGTDVKGIDASVAGILGISRNTFAMVDVALDLVHGPDLAHPGDAATDAFLEAGIGIGWRITQRIITKFEVFTPDLVELSDIHFLVLLVTRFQPEQKSSPDDWL